MALDVNRGASQSSVNVSTASLLRGAEILDSVARYGVVKEELPEDEAEILTRMEACMGLMSLLTWASCYHSNSAFCCRNSKES